MRSAARGRDPEGRTDAAPPLPRRVPHDRGAPGAKSFVDDLILGQGFVRSRAAPSLRSIENQPSTQAFVRPVRLSPPPRGGGGRGSGLGAGRRARARPRPLSRACRAGTPTLPPAGALPEGPAASSPGGGWPPGAGREQAAPRRATEGSGSRPTFFFRISPFFFFLLSPSPLSRVSG